MITITLIIFMTIVFAIAFWLGKDYEKKSILENTVGVMAHFNKYTDEIEKVVYYYSKEAYDEDMAVMKQEGIEVVNNEEE